MRHFLHNYLMGVDPSEKLIEVVDRELASRDPKVYPSLV